MIRICIKDLRLFFADRKSIFLTFLLPLVLVSVFAIAFGGLGRPRTTFDAIEIPWTDLDQSGASQALLALVESSGVLQPFPATEYEARELIRTGKRPAALIIRSGFADSLDQTLSLPIVILLDEARQAENSIVVSVCLQILKDMAAQAQGGERFAAELEAVLPDLPAGNVAAIQAAFEKVYADSRSTKVEVMQSRVTAAPRGSNAGLVQAIAGTTILMLLFSVASLGAGLLEEKEAGTLRRLLTTPIRPMAIIFGKQLAAMVVSFAQLVLMFSFAGAVFGLDLFINVPALLLMILSTAFACAGFGVLLASVARTRKQVSGLSTIVILIMSALGGSMVPLFLMPDIFRQFAVFSVNYWAIEGFMDVFWRGMSLEEVMPRIMVLLAIGAGLTAMAAVLFSSAIRRLMH